MRVHGSKRAVILAVVLATMLLALLPAVAVGAVGAQLNERGALVVGGEPRYLLAGADGTHLFVSDFAGGAVVQLDLASGLVERRLPAPDGPVGLALSADGQSLYAASYFGGKVFRYRLDDGRLEATLDLGADSYPWDLKLVSGAGGRMLLAVTEHHNNRVSFFDPATFTRVASLPTAYYPYQMDVDPVRGRLYVASYGGKNGGELMAVDLAGLTRIWASPTGQGSFDVQADLVHDHLLVTDFVGGSVTTFLPDGTRIGDWGVVGGPKGARLSGDGSAYLTAIQTLGVVACFDAASGYRQYSTTVGALPGPLAWVRKSGISLLAVGNQGDGTISLLSSGDPVPEFTDVPVDHRFHREIRVLALRGALNGYPDGGGTYSFRPDDTLTRAQIAKILVGSLGLHTATVEPAFVEFTDVLADTGEYPYDFVQEAARKGIVSGLSGLPPRFGPYQPVTRIQLIRMAVRAAEAVGSPLPVPEGASPFVDVDSSSADFPYVMAAYAAGLVAGGPGPDGLLRLQPYASATRGQTAHVVFALLAALHKAPLE